MTSTSTNDFDLENEMISNNKKTKDIRYTLIYIMAAAFAAVILIDLLG